jgi:hypothetical protein
MGVAAVLLALWALAAFAASILGDGWLGAAAALDPARSGSIVDLFATCAVLLAFLASLSSPRTRYLALTPAALLLGESGELHIHLGTMLAAHGHGEVTTLGAKLLATALLGAMAA